MRTAHLVHGFNVTDGGASTIDRVARYLPRLGYVPRRHAYGWRGLLGTLLGNPAVARSIASQVTPGDIGIGHSNGCAILSRVAELGAPLAGLVFINPALDNCWVAPAHVKWVRVFHSGQDAAVSVAKLIPFVRWGDMGAAGYVGQDPRYINIDISPYSHSEFFEHVDKWWQELTPLR